jgi:hypothetical protein
MRFGFQLSPPSSVANWTSAQGCGSLVYFAGEKIARRKPCLSSANRGRHVQIRPPEHRTDDLRVLSGVHHPTCQGMPKRVEAETFYHLAIDVGLSVIPDLDDVHPYCRRP